jgi:hypothetical protein
MNLWNPFQKDLRLILPVIDPPSIFCFSAHAQLDVFAWQSGLLVRFKPSGLDGSFTEIHK